MLWTFKHILKAMLYKFSKIKISQSVKEHDVCIQGFVSAGTWWKSVPPTLAEALFSLLTTIKHKSPACSPAAPTNQIS